MRNTVKGYFCAERRRLKLSKTDTRGKTQKQDFFKSPETNQSC